MREIRYIVAHCTATQQSVTVESIQAYWRNVLKWKSPGYHYLVRPDGSYLNLLPIEQVSNGVQGFNSVSIHVSFIGGVDKNNKPVDNRTPAQKATMLKLILELKSKFRSAVVQGHRDFPNVHKACPCFDAKKEYANI